MTLPTPIVRDPKFDRGRSIRGRLLFFVVAWALVIIPLVVWRGALSGGASDDRHLSRYLHDDRNPDHVREALIQIGQRISQHDLQVPQFYPDLLRLASHPAEEVRSTDAWLMGQDTSRPEFRPALLALLKDPAPLVRNNAALSLVRFGDDSGHAQLVAMLQPFAVLAPASGRAKDLGEPGGPVRQGDTIAKLKGAAGKVKVRAPIPGRLRSITVTTDSQVQAGAVLALIDPGPAQVFEALRALAQVGRKEDLPALAPYKSNIYNFPEKVQAQAVETEQAILKRSAPK